MAPRLAVVVSQSPTRDARTADIEESIVAELIMVGGLDATLVGPLERIEADSTDQLCLSGFTQDLALLSWMSADEAARHWQTLQLGGTIVPMSLDGSAEIGSGERGVRRVFYIQLKSDSQAKQVCQQLKARLDLMRVKPVSLQLTLKSPTKAPVASPAAIPSHSPNESALNHTDSKVAVNATNNTPSPSPAIAKSPQANDDRAPHAAKNSQALHDSGDEEWMELDRLVDDLDALDL